jgi:hypothetical protein
MSGWLVYDFAAVHQFFDHEEAAMPFDNGCNGQMSISG